MKYLKHIIIILLFISGCCSLRPAFIVSSQLIAPIYDYAVSVIGLVLFVLMPFFLVVLVRCTYKRYSNSALSHYFLFSYLMVVEVLYISVYMNLHVRDYMQNGPFYQTKILGFLKACVNNPNMLFDVLFLSIFCTSFIIHEVFFIRPKTSAKLFRTARTVLFEKTVGTRSYRTVIKPLIAQTFNGFRSIFKATRSEVLFMKMTAKKRYKNLPKSVKTFVKIFAVIFILSILDYYEFVNFYAYFMAFLVFFVPPILVILISVIIFMKLESKPNEIFQRIKWLLLIPILVSCLWIYIWLFDAPSFGPHGP